MLYSTEYSEPKALKWKRTKKTSDMAKQVFEEAWIWQCNQIFRLRIVGQW
jgi:hypothetical protein